MPCHTDAILHLFAFGIVSLDLENIHIWGNWKHFFPRFVLLGPLFQQKNSFFHPRKKFCFHQPEKIKSIRKPDSETEIKIPFSITNLHTAEAQRKHCVFFLPENKSKISQSCFCPTIKPIFQCSQNPSCTLILCVFNGARIFQHKKVCVLLCRPLHCVRVCFIKLQARVNIHCRISVQSAA